MTLGERLRQIGLTRGEAARTPPRHAALRDDPVAVALACFRDGALLPLDRVRALLEGVVVPEGLLEAEAGGVRSTYRLELVDSLFLFSDRSATEPDSVLPPGETSAILYRAARSLCFERSSVLDLGCGSGTLALLLAATADRVCGCDINPRAISLACLNAGINGIENARFLRGDLYAPVSDRTFDLILCQPPYLPAAGSEARLFLEGGARGDELARAVLAGAAAHLAPGGRLLLFSDWPLAAGETVKTRFASCGLHALLLRSPLVTVEGYASGYGPAVGESLRRAGAAGVCQCLAVLSPGSGIECRTVLPHEWACVDTLIRDVPAASRLSSHGLP